MRLIALTHRDGIFAQQRVEQDGELSFTHFVMDAPHGMHDVVRLLLDGEVIGEWSSYDGIPRLSLHVEEDPEPIDLDALLDGALENADDLPRVVAEQRVLNEVFNELQSQHEQWGVQNHPIHSGRHSRILSYVERARFWKRENTARARDGQLSWDGILLEEVYEALEQRDAALQRPELIQAAAVAVQAVLTLDRRA